MSRYMAGTPHLEKKHELYEKERYSNKVLIVRNNGILYSILFRENRIYKVAREERCDFPLGTVLIGKVVNVVKQLDGAFLELENTKGTGKTMGYLPVREKDVIRPLNRKPDGRILNGDDILVQVVREAQKTKPLQLTLQISLTGQFVAVKKGSGWIDFSRKLDAETGKQLTEAFEDWKQKAAAAEQENPVQEFDIIFRTNSSYAAWENVEKEMVDLISQLKNIDRLSQNRTAYSILYQPEAFYLEFIKNLPLFSLGEVVTDEEDVEKVLKNNAFTGYVPVRLYRDEKISLKNVYALDTRFRELLTPKVYMKSGAYLVIEQTEALVSVDVNTGKAEKKTEPEEFYFQTNLEAVKEVCYQMSARNLSGMILIDFINMKEIAHRNEILTALKEEAKKDAVPTRFIDFTRLGLAEVTRKKISQPLQNTLRDWKYQN